MRANDGDRSPMPKRADMAVICLRSDLVCDGSNRDIQEASRRLVFAWFHLSRGLTCFLSLGLVLWGSLRN